MLYGSECWEIKKLNPKIENVKMDKWILRDRIRNECIVERLRGCFHWYERIKWRRID